MSTEVNAYLKYCQNFQVKANEDVLSSLKLAMSTGELILAKKTLSNWTWEILGKILSKSKNIRKLDFGDCFIQYKGLVCLLSNVEHSSFIHTIQLKGNNIQATAMSSLGSLLKNNTTLKVLLLEWNNLGSVPEMFCMFCDGLSANVGLETLDLKNNCLPPQVARDLAHAILKNKTLKSLDLRWNSIGCRGGQIIYAAMQKNQSITKIKLDGNCIQEEVLRAIENCAKHNRAQQSIVASYTARAEILKGHMKNQEIEITDKYEKLARESEQKIQDIMRLEEEKIKKLEEKLKESEEVAENAIKQSESRLTLMESTLSERNDLITKLQNTLKDTEAELVKSKNNIEVLQKTLAEKETALNDISKTHQATVEDLKQKLLEKDEEYQSALSEFERKFLVEQRQNSLVQIRLQSREEEVQELNAEISQLNDKIKQVRKQYEEAVLKKEADMQEQLVKKEQEMNMKLARVQMEMSTLEQNLLEKIQALKLQCETLEKSKSELQHRLHLEQAQKDESIAVAVQNAKAKEANVIVQLEEKISALREEKVSLEKQLSMSHSTVSQLQQQNTTIIAELAEPQRKINKLHEELSQERINVQRVKHELTEARLREQERKKEIEKLEEQVESFQRHIRETARNQEERNRKYEEEIERLKNSISEKHKEISAIRSQEVERVGVLYSAFSTYLASLGPAAALPKPPLQL